MCIAIGHVVYIGRWKLVGVKLELNPIMSSTLNFETSLQGGHAILLLALLDGLSQMLMVFNHKGVDVNT